MSSLKVALISEEYPPYMIGGAGTFCYYLARYLSEKRIPTTVFSGRSKKIFAQKVNDYLEVVRLPCFDFPPRFIWFQLQNFRSISKKLKNYSVIHAVTPEVSPICVYLKKKLKSPLVTSYHGFTKYEMKAFIEAPISQWTLGDLSYHVLEYPLFEMFTRLSLTNSDHAVSCSYTILNELRSNYEGLDLERSSVIYNGIDLEEIESIRNSSTKADTENDFTLIYYGRLLWLKGITYLIEAFRILVNDFPNLKLKIFGKGPLGHAILVLASDSSLKNRIQILGHVPRTRLLFELMKADVAVLPSLREAQPLSVLEAMAARKPVVAFNLPFANEYIKDSYNGMLAKAKDPIDLANKIKVLLSDAKLRHQIGENAYKYVEQNHNWNLLIDKYIDVYKKVAHF